MKKIFVACLVALGSITAFTVSAYNNDSEGVRTEQVAIVPNYLAQEPNNQVPCDPVPCNNPAPCDTTCNPAPCNPAPCNPGC